MEILFAFSFKVYAHQQILEHDPILILDDLYSCQSSIHNLLEHFKIILVAHSGMMGHNLVHHFSSLLPSAFFYRLLTKFQYSTQVQLVYDVSPHCGHLLICVVSYHHQVILCDDLALSISLLNLCCLTLLQSLVTAFCP